MAEIDYQMALLLQHQFEQEHKTTKSTEKTDQELARELQEQFAFEESSERPSNGLVYKPPKDSLNSSKCLVDPSWELVDPTPDIHNLFMAFNERYFWNKLLAVCVSWSKRMTTCAGVCSYNGRGGMCSITLSEPLLKLRPRKDLIETLLHEMIHAYLFVTHNNRDRDGHGPEFHKHMYRINKESGTNITVYHDFHDEVRLYQQHWWRCDGPCQLRKPFFGMVRRSMNRPPGPNDRWWAEHSRTCNGTFIKVKEPENNKKEKKTNNSKTAVTAKNKDIRDFVTATSTSGSSSNIKGFKDLNKVKGGKMNSSSTIVVTKTSNTANESSFTPTVFNADAGVVKKPSTSINTSNDFLSVRNHWANKFSDTNKRPAEEAAPSTSKVPKIPSQELCDCPVCNKKVPLKDLNSHLDVCLNEVKDEKKECPVCTKKVESSIFEVHIEKCLSTSTPDTQETVPCLACGKKILRKNLNSHLDDCMSGIFDADFETKAEDRPATPIGESISQFNCPFCLKLVKEEEMKDHIDVCLLAERDIVETFMDEF